ncbi:MAG: hypothetical protein V3U84_03300 [Thiotrichaceae bacterium]
MKFLKTPIFYWQTIQSAVLVLIFQSWGYAGVSDHLARETIIKHLEGNNVATISQYSNLYLIELIALGLVATALLAVTFSIFTRLKSGKKEQKKLLSLRRSAEQDKKIFNETLIEINNIGKKVEQNADEAEQQVNRITESVNEIEQHSDTVSNIELEMKQLVDGTTERMTHIQDYWEQQLKDTTDAMRQINHNLKQGIDKTTEQGNQAETLLDSLTRIKLSNNHVAKQGDLSINIEIKETLDLTLKESKELLTQIKDYQEQAKEAFSSFTNTLSGFESQAHEQFDEIFNTADMARQELNANLDESREYMKIFRKDDKPTDEEEQLILEGIDKKPKLESIDDKEDDKEPTKIKPPSLTEKTSKQPQTDNDETKLDNDEDRLNAKGRKGRPIIDMNDAQDLTDPSLIKKYGKYPINPAAEEEREEDKNLVSLFSKFRHHGS